MRNRIPSEVVASVLAATTVILSLPPTNLPPWAVFVSWAGTFAAGGPTKAFFKRIYPVMPLGSTTAMVIVLVEKWTSPVFPGNWNIAGQMIIIFVLNGLMLMLARRKFWSFAPGMFFGFSSYFATYFGGWGPIAHNPYSAWIAVMIMNAIGPLYAWLNVKLTFPVASTSTAAESVEQG
jgi:hypothetical protein